MGYHHLNAALVDLVVEATQPELLVYAPGPHDQLQLVAVEYMVPAGLFAEWNPDVSCS